jgi:hypothetical protein
MDLKSESCPVKRELQEQSFILVGQLSALIVRVGQLAGRSREEFQPALAACQLMRKEVADSRQRIVEHRSAHKC